MYPIKIGHRIKPSEYLCRGHNERDILAETIVEGRSDETHLCNVGKDTGELVHDGQLEGEECVEDRTRFAWSDGRFF